jgi:hypothetical protein
MCWTCPDILAANPSDVDLLVLLAVSLQSAPPRPPRAPGLNHITTVSARNAALETMLAGCALAHGGRLELTDLRRVTYWPPGRKIGIG